MSVEQYEKIEKNNVSERTLKTRVSIIQTFLKNVDGEPTPQDLEDYLSKLIDLNDEGEIKASTVSEYFKSIRRYYNMMLNIDEDIEYLEEWIPEQDSDPGDYLKPDEFNKFRDNLRGFRDKALIDVMYFYSRRPREVLLINDEDIDTEEGEITFNILKKKDSRDTVELVTEDDETYQVFRATFDIPPDSVNSLDKWLKYKPDVERSVTLDGVELDVHPTFCSENGRISYSTVYNTVKQATERANIDKNITPKSLRHSRITHLDHAGKSPEQIARHQALHSPNSDVIGRYIHEKDEQDVRDVMRLE